MNPKFSDRLREVREKKGWSQADLAEAAKLQVTAISHFETNRRSPSFDNLRKLADALKVTSDYLIGRSEVPNLSSTAELKMFRKAKNLTADDLAFVEQMIENLAERNKGNKQ